MGNSFRCYISEDICTKLSMVLDAYVCGNRFYLLKIPGGPGFDRAFISNLFCGFYGGRFDTILQLTRAAMMWCSKFICTSL